MDCLQNNNLLPNVYEMYVNYQDVDAGGVVFHAHYITFACNARAHLVRQLFGIEEEKTRYWVVRSLQVEYLAPARLNDLITIKTYVVEMKNCTIVFQQEFFVDNKLIVKIILKIVTMDTNLAFMKIPDNVKIKLREFLIGENT